MKLCALVVEDEAISRRGLVEMVKRVSWLEYAGEADSVSTALTLMQDTQPDVLFLDIKVPGGSGFDILKRGPFVRHVIFTTAYPEFAVDAFEVNAVDYLLKPFSRQRFECALNRLRTRVRAFSRSSALGSGFLFVREGNKNSPVSLADVDYFCADGDYVAICGSDRQKLLSSSLSALEGELDSTVFVRAHRTFIVNIHNIRFMRREGDRQLRLFMRNGDELVTSRSGTKRLRTFIKI